MASADASDQPFRDYRRYLRERYGSALYRIPIDLGFGCPHRQADGSGGCDFCGPDLARAAHLCSEMDLATQVAAGLRVARERGDGQRFIAYFQAGTATYAPAAVLQERVQRVLAAACFPVVVFATRPDCLPPAVLDYLAGLGRDHEVWVELGVQTSHDATLARLHRGHDFACSMRAARDLHARGVAVAAHVILGLPGEGPAEFARTAQRLCEAPFSGIKIHDLHIVRGTALESPWRRGEIEVMDEHAYGEVLMAFLRQIPGTWPVLRLSADTARDQLLAPQWWMTKGEFRQYVVAQMRQRGWSQGDSVPVAGTPPCGSLTDAPADRTRRLQPVDLPWERRQAASPLNSLLGAVVPGRFRPARAAVVLAVGFGQGVLALDGLDVLPGRVADRLLIHGLTGDSEALARRTVEYPDYAGLLNALVVRHRCRRTWGRVAVHWGDPRKTLVRLSGRVDLVLLEPDHAEACPSVFTLDFLRRVVRLMPPGAVLLSACSSPALRGALLRLGLTVGHASGPALPRGGTVAAWTPASVRLPLPERERRLASECTSGIPYRDRGLNWTRKRILHYHEKLAERMRSRGMPTHLPESPTPAGAVGDAPA